MKFDENTKIKEHFQVPENYFEQFNARMMDMLPEQSAPQPMKVVGGTRRLWTRYVAAAAAVAVLLVSAVTLFFNKSASQGADNKDALIAQVTQKDSSAKPQEPVMEPEAPQIAEVKMPAASEPEVKFEKTAKMEKTVEAPAKKSAEAETVPTYSPRHRQSEAMTVSYDQSEVDRASVYMCIDNQDVSAMLYEASF